jgi:hypothetical protein
MTSRPAIGLAVCAAIAALMSALPPIIERLSPPAGLVRSVFPQLAFGGAPIDARTTEINLRFLDEQAQLPRQNFSARWRGFFYVSQPQTIEIFAGGNDEVELRVDGALLLRRSLADGMRTIGHRVRLEAGSHELAVDYQQFGGSMALNIQRALEGQQPGPFSPAELFSRPVDSREVLILAAARWMRQMTPYVWAGLAVLAIVTFAALNFRTWRRLAAPQSAREYAGRLWLFAAPALLVPAVVFGLGPHTIFANNAAEFAVAYGELAAPWLLRTVALNWLVLLAIGAIIAVISERFARMYAAALFAIGLLLWGQGNIWNADYGVLAGQDIDLGVHASRAPYELGVWAAVLLSALVFFRRVSRIAPFASLVFLGVQTAGVALSSAESVAAQRVRWVEPPTAIYQFSPAQNVIHIVLDEFQSDVFHDIFQQDRPALDRQFSGFQYFADHAGSFPTTSFSMPAMLAGQEYRNQKPAPEFVREAFKQSSVFEKVSQAGFDVDAMSIVPIDSFEQWLGPEATPNWKGARFRIRKPFVSREDYREVSARQLLELSLFRHVPHAAKAFSIERPRAFYQPIWMDRTESPAQVRRHEASNSAAFLEQFIGSMTVGRDRPVYKLLHVGVPHRPIVVDRECRFIGVTAMSRQSYTEQSRCALRLVATLLDRVRALGIYDSSLIIVSSDHGTDLQPLGFNGRSESLSLVPGPSTVRLPAIASTAKAVMLIKRPRQTGPITISEAPTSHIDVPSTVLGALGLPGGSADGLMFDRDPGQPRRRVFGMYNPHVRFPKAHLDRLDVLTIDGRVLDAAAWNVERLIWRPDLRLDSRAVDLGPRTGNYYLGPGWSLEKREAAGDSQQTTFVQALTNRAIIAASLPTAAVELVLRASSPVESGPQSIGVDVDGRPAPKPNPSTRDGYGDILITIPPDPSRPPISHITLHFDAGGRPDFVFKLDRLTIR